MQERGVIDGATSLKREVMASGQGGGREASVMQKDGRLMWNGEGFHLRALVFSMK